jgi:hypothetical protein
MKTENQTTAVKQEYQVPVLSELGRLNDITLNAAASGSDGNAQSAN